MATAVVLCSRARCAQLLQSLPVRMPRPRNCGGRGPQGARIAGVVRTALPHPDRPRLAIITCDPVLGYQADGHTEANFVVIAEG